LGSFLGRIFTSWRPGFSHFHKAKFKVVHCEAWHDLAADA
jgi:hypothetical protein